MSTSQAFGQAWSDYGFQPGDEMLRREVEARIRSSCTDLKGVARLMDNLAVRLNDGAFDLAAAAIRLVDSTRAVAHD